jgi:hypothetical protein
MRRRPRSFSPRITPLTFAAFAALAPIVVGLFSCRDTVEVVHPQLVVQIDTDALVPKDVTGFEYELQQNGTAVQAEPVRGFFDGQSGDRLPGTLSFVAGEQSPGALFAIRVWGLSGAKRVSLREVLVRMPTEAQGIRLLPMPIQQACVAASPCRETPGDCEPVPCYDGVEVAAGAEVPTGELPLYEPALVFGGGDDKGNNGSCFQAQACFAGDRSLRLTPHLETRPGEGEGAGPEEVCVVDESSFGVAVDPSIVNFAIRRVLPKASAPTLPEEVCALAGSGDSAETLCFLPLSARAAGRPTDDPYARFVDPFSVRHEGSAYLLPAAVCRLSSDAALVVSASCPQKTNHVPRCGWSSVSGQVIDPTTQPTGFAGFPPQSYCEGTGEQCDDLANCLGKRCLPPPAEPGACFLDRHCTAPAVCENAVICPSQSACDPPEAPGTCIVPATTCFVRDQCAADEVCVRETGCAAAGLSGVCQKRPTTCADAPKTPVCGCDLGAYASACEAAQSGAGVFAEGNCTPCLSVGNGSYCATALGYPASRKRLTCSGGSKVAEEDCATACQTLGAGQAACQ